MKNKSLLVQLSVFAVVAVILVVLGSARNSQGSDNKKTLAEKPKAETIEIIYFHSTARCISCKTLQEYTEETINEFFQKELASGKITFRAVNVDLPENKELALKFKATGSSLKINEIYDKTDHIGEDTRVWSYLGDKDSFKNYLKNRIESRLK